MSGKQIMSATTISVPVAQLDRVAPSEGEGQAFESPQGRH